MLNCAAFPKWLIVPDRTYRWLIVAYTIVLQAVTVGSIIYCFALFAPPWLDEFEATRAEVMLAIALLQMSFGFISPLVGGAMDRLRMRTIVLAGSVCFGLGWWLLSVASELWQVFVIYAVVFPVAMTTMGTLAAQTLITRWFSAQRGLAIGISAMGTNVGGILMPLLVAPSLALGLWREVAFWLLAGGLAVVVPLTWFVLARRAPGELPASTSGSNVTGLDVLRSRTFWVLALGMLPLNLTFSALQFNLGVFAADLGFAERSGWLIAISSACMIGGKMLFGLLGDWIDHRALNWIAVACMLFAMMVLQGEPSWWLLVAGVVLFGAAGGSLLPVMGIVVGARFELASFGRAMGMVMLMLSVAALGPVLAGWIFDVTGSYDLAFKLCSGAMVVGAVVMWWLPPPIPQQS